MSATPAELPGVSYVVPVLNEESTIGLTVDSILAQDYAGPRDIALVHGPSRDGTAAALARIVAAHPGIVVVDNPRGRTPVAMNLGFAATRHPIVIRVDGHAVLPQAYTSTLVHALDAHGAVNVGGVMSAQGGTTIQRVVAWAYNSRVGLGGGVHHRAGEPGPAETAYLGVFRREAVEAVGGFDEQMARAQDWELNSRLRKAGGLIWFEPSVEVVYYPRASFGALARQFWSSGRWRATLMREDFAGSPLRYLAPPALVLALLLSAAALMAAIVATGTWSVVLAVAGAVVPTIYALAVIGAAVTARGLSWRERVLVLAVLPVIHVWWGAGCLTGLFGKRAARAPRRQSTEAK